MLENKKIGIITQARMGSSRLPAKVLKEIDGKPLLQYHIDRLSASHYFNNLVVATTDLSQDNVIVEFCKLNNLNYFRGAEQDVLDRYYQCALQYRLDIIVRVTSDCPLVDPYLLDECVDAFLKQGAEYLGTTHPSKEPRYPDGSDVEVFTFKALENAWKNAVNYGEKKYKGNEREHVTTYIYETFKNASFPAPFDCKQYHYSVDTIEDFNLVAKVISKLDNHLSTATYEDIVETINTLNK